MFDPNLNNHRLIYIPDDVESQVKCKACGLRYRLLDNNRLKDRLNEINEVFVKDCKLNKQYDCWNAFLNSLVFSDDTAAPGTTFPRIVPSSGHCAAVAVLAQREFGGDLVSANICGVSHWYNRIDGHDVDFTADQFSFEKLLVLDSKIGLYRGCRVRPLSEVNEETLSRSRLMDSRREKYGQ